MENLTTEQPTTMSMDELDKPGILYIDDEEDNLVVLTWLCLNLPSEEYTKCTRLFQEKKDWRL